MEQPPPSSPLNKLTFVGRLLLLIHLVLFVGGTALYICDFLPQFPPGRYPVLMFAIPVGLVCFFLFLLLAWLLERVGIRVYKP
jgi:hypothetical protein